MDLKEPRGPGWKSINEAIHRKDPRGAKKLILSYLRAHRSSPEAIYEASEFFRKNADYSNALRVLPMEKVAASKSAPSDIEIKLELQVARILSVLGASHYALRMVERIRADKRAKSKVEMVEIYHCSCKFQDVFDLLGPDFALPETEPWHQDWLLHIYYSYALNALKMRKRAVEHVEGMYSLSASPLIRAIALGLKGQFLVESGELKKALPILLKARKFFDDNDPSFDHGSIQKWTGICYLKLGKLPEAKEALEKAFAIFYQPSLKPEDWMEMLLWLDQIPGYRDSTQQIAPRLAALGGAEYTPLTEVGISDSSNESEIFSTSRIEPTRRLKHIDRASDMAWQGKRPRIGLDFIDELIWNLTYAGEYGLPQFKLYELLWPDEPFSFDQHRKRLERLVARARTQGYKILWKDLHLRLTSKNVSASGRPRKVVRGGAFLKERSTFTTSEVRDFFSISSTTAKALCRTWVSEGVVIPVKKSQYKTTVS